MHFYLYEIKNNINGKIYIGVHRTPNLDDGYMGSGRLLARAKAKYGESNFSKVILEHFQTEDAMYAREKQIVDSIFLERDDTYNLMLGGHGGFDYIIRSGKHSSVSNRGKKKSAAEISRRSETLGRMYASGDLDHVKEKSRQRCLTKNPMSTEEARVKSSLSHTGKLKSDEHKMKISRSLTGKPYTGKSRSGEANSQFGTFWITNGTENLKIQKDAVIPEGWTRGMKNNHLGTIWITDGISSKKIDKNAEIPVGWAKGRKTSTPVLGTINKLS